MQLRDNDFIGAVKIKDGLFMGDQYAAQDYDLLSANKISHIINCAGRELVNHFESMGVVYLTLTWQETDYQVLFEGKFDVLNHVYRFIEGALSKGESVLVHSTRGQNRCYCAVAAYCMKKYRWTLLKTLEFLQCKKTKMNIRPNFMSQLVNLENKLTRMGQGARSYNWKDVENSNNMESDELLVTNTFLNSKPLLRDERPPFIMKEYKPSKIMWVDQQPSVSDAKPSLTTVLYPKTKTKNNEGATPRPAINIKENDGKPFVKSILKLNKLKGSDKVFYLSDPKKEKPSDTKAPRAPSSDNNTNSDLSNYGKKSVVKLRPGSAMVSSEKSLGLGKSNSTPFFDKMNPDMKVTKIQGNIINITVNNFIANNVRPSSSKGSASKSEAQSFMDRSNGLSVNVSNSDFTTSASKQTSLQNSMTVKRILVDKNQRDPKVLFQKEDNALSLPQNARVNNFTKEPTIVTPFAVVGTRPSKFEPEKGQQNVRRIIQPMKAFKIEETNPGPANKTAAIYNSSTGMIKYFSNKKSTLRFSNEIDVSQSASNFYPEVNSRPLTAPNKNAKKRQDSPYSYPENYVLINDPQRENRGNSLQPKKDGPKMFVTKNKVKVALPTEANYASYIPKTKVIL